MGSVRAFRLQGDTLTALPIEAATLDEATLQIEEHGVYSVFRIYAGERVLRLQRHFERMRQSAAMLGQPYPISDEWLRDAVRRAVRASGLQTPRVRLTVPSNAPHTALILLEPFDPPPPALYEQGVRVALARAHRERPRAKDSHFVEMRNALRAEYPDAYEVLLYDERERILEGTSSNFYAVLGGMLRTAGDGVLEGVARSILLEVAPAVLPVYCKPVTLSDLPRLDEAFLTSSSRGVVPIVQIGDVTIGMGMPGPITLRLRARYDAQVEAELKPL